VRQAENASASHTYSPAISAGCKQTAAQQV
jgi:hypothetical protein